MKASWLAILLCAGSLEATAQDCLRVETRSDAGVKKLADAIYQRIASLQKLQRETPARPTILLKTVQFDEPEVSGVPSTSVASALRRIACIDGKDLQRAVIGVLGNNYDVGFVSDSTDPLIAEWADRVNRVGYGRIDEKSVSRDKVKAINYFVVVGGRAVVQPESCSFAFTLDLKFDVHAMGPRTVQVGEASVKPSSGPRYDSDYLEIAYESGTQDSLGAIILRTNKWPACLGNSKIEVSAKGSNSVGWNENVGCIGPNQTKRIAARAIPGIYRNQVGTIELTGASVCGLWSVDDVPLAEVFSPRGHGGGGNGAAPPGTVLRGCGCYGPTTLNVPFSAPQCGSGVAVNLACNGYCNGRGYAYGTQCQ